MQPRPSGSIEPLDEFFRKNRKHSDGLYVYTP
jgi:hypothetical protein